MYIEIVPGTKCWVAYFLSVSQSMLSLILQSKDEIIQKNEEKKNRKDNFFFRQEKADVPNVAYTKVNQCPQIVQKEIVLLYNSQVQAMDTWTGTCIMFAFIALVEVVTKNLQEP